MAPKKVRGVPPVAQTVVQCLQPYNGLDCRPAPSHAHPMDRPLAQLFALDNWDKHRALTLTQEIASHVFVGLDKLGILAPRTPSMLLADRMKRDAPMVTLELVNGDRLYRPEVDVYVKVTYQVSFGVAGPVPFKPVLNTLDFIRRDLRNRVLPAFIPFFPPR